MIVITTSFGDIKIELNKEKAPETTTNFEQYVKDGFYDGTIFHRVIDNFNGSRRRHGTRHERKNNPRPLLRMKRTMV